MSLSVPDSCQTELFSILQSYAGCPLVSVDVNSTLTAPQLTVDDGKTVLRGQTAALRWLASQSPRADQLLGATSEERCKIAEILSLCRGMVSSSVLDKEVEALNGWLERRTFVATTQLSLADLVLFEALSGVVGKFPMAQHGHFCNVLRWYDNVWYLVGGSFGVDVAKVVRKDGLCLPVAATVEKDKKEKTTNNEEKKTKKSDEKTKKGDEKTKDKEMGAKGAEPQDAKVGKADKKDKTKAATANNKPPKKADLPKEEPTVDYLDIRVGKILEVGPHPDADALYVEKIDLGEAEPRTVVSGLRKFVSEADMLNRMVAVVCNLKPAKMRGILSTGMVLCASNDDHTAVDPILIPEGSTIGSRIAVDGYSRDPEEQINPKKKIFERIAPDMRVAADGVCGYKGAAFKTDGGVVTATIPNASIA